MSINAFLNTSNKPQLAYLVEDEEGQYIEQKIDPANIPVDRVDFACKVIQTTLIASSVLLAIANLYSIFS